MKNWSRHALIASALLLSPAVALGGMFNTAPVVDSLTISPSPAPANGTATITCAAHDPDGNVTALKLTVSGGTLPGGAAAESLVITAGPTASGSLAWSTPAVGSYTVTCQANDNGGTFGGSAVATLSTPVTVSVPLGAAPVIDSFAASASSTLLGGTITFAAAAHDVDSPTLTWTWTTSGGSLTAGQDGATWTAPSRGGAYSVTVTVTDPLGLTASSSLTVNVSSDRFTTSLPGTSVAPRRVAVLPSGDFAVLDASSSSLSFLTPRGEVKGRTELPEFSTSVAACAGGLYVGTATGRLLTLDDQGRLTGQLALSGGKLAWPAGLACDPVQGLLFAAERDASRVRALWPDGTTAFTLREAGTDVLQGPVDVAVDPAGRRLFVLLDSYLVGSQRQVHAFGLDGIYRGGFVPFGGGPGKVTRGAGLTFSQSGRLYVADAFQGTVQVFDGAGNSVAEVGAFGTSKGELQQPSGLALTARGDLLVSNTGLGRVDVFGSGVPLPACLNDLDCDGLPDAWELANGLNPRDPRDAFADSDGDGLTNGQEFAWKTNPRSSDTDGDGWSDGEEVAQGFDPIGRFDHRATFAALSVSSDPGLVQLDGAIVGRGTCSVAWSQTGGPTVTLRGATTPTPTFVGRAAGRYTFTATPSCNGILGVASPVEAFVNELAPVAIAGPPLAVATGETIELNALSSWDPNGGLLSWSWDQLLGPPRLGTTASPTALVRAGGPGLYVFAVTATDPAQQAAVAEQHVVVTNPALTTLTTVVNTPVEGEVGRALQLDASGTVGPRGPAITWQWRQLMGPSVVLTPVGSATPGFIPTDAGHYRFEVTARQGPVATVPALVDVYVAEAQLNLPVAAAPAQLSAAVGQPVALDGTRSAAASPSSALGYRWRQLSGPPAGLTRKDEATAMVVPFAAGTFVFELVVTDGAMESLPAQVRLDADLPGHVRPVAVATAAAVETVGVEVLLDARGSTGPLSSTSSYRWTQAAGPWVALTDGRTTLAAFTPRAPGLYVFQLEVSADGVTSAPATVGVLVFPAADSGGRQP